MFVFCYSLKYGFWERDEVAPSCRPDLRAKLWSAKSFRGDIVITLMKFERFAKILGSALYRKTLILILCNRTKITTIV